MLKNHQLGSLPAIAVVIPCFNEALAITAVLDEFKAALPEASVYVFDNNSTDDTARLAAAKGATGSPVLMRGKGNVIRRMFADVEADIYVMVDGDATYDVSKIRHHIDLLMQQRLDMVVGCRKDDAQNPQTYRTGHRWVNRLITGS